MYNCECGKQFKKQSSLNSHARFCDKYIKKNKPSKYKIGENLYKCECDKEFESSQGLNGHFGFCLIHRKNVKPEKRSRENPGKYFEGKRNWNKGLTKETDERVKKCAETLSRKYKEGLITPSFLGKHHKDQAKEKLSVKQTLQPSGGTCKWYNYTKPDGSIHRVQGTWELKFAKYLDTIDKDWIKPGAGKIGHTYLWIDHTGNKRRYTPDFWCPTLRKYFEVKGFWRDYNRLKMKSVIEQNNLNIEIIEKEQMKQLNLL